MTGKAQGETVLATLAATPLTSERLSLGIGVVVPKREQPAVGSLKEAFYQVVELELTEMPSYVQ
jgi:hypothetical protein